MAITNITNLEAALKRMGYKDLKRINGVRTAILTDGNRVEILENVEQQLMNEGAVYDRTPRSGLSLGLVKLGKLSVIAKPKSAQGAKSAGIDNEIVVIRAINDYIKENGGPLKVTFKAGGKTFTSANIIECIEVGRDTSGNKKADILLKPKSGSNIPISIKKDNAETWESADRRYGAKAKEVIDKLLAEEKINLELQPGNFYKISPNVAVKATADEKKEVVFGSDLGNGGAVITRTFSSRDFVYNGAKSELTINVSSIITTLAEVRGDKDVFFLIRNNRDRNTPTLYKGIRVLAVYKTRINPKVLVV